MAFYSFDGNTLDSVGNYSMSTNPLLFFSNYVTGLIGSAVIFGSSHTYLSSSVRIPLDSRSFTIDFWFYATTLTNTDEYGFAGECSFTTTDQCLFFSIRNSILYMAFYNDDTNGITTLTTNQWYHATFVYDSTAKMQLIYLNGVLEKSGTVSNDFLDTSALFTIGRSSTNILVQTFVYYLGYIDHFQISYRVKTPCEIYMNAILFCYFSFDLPSFLTDSGPNYLSAANSNGISTIGRRNQGIQFSSATLSYVTISGVNVLNSSTNSFTISMWIKPSNLTGGGTLLHTSTQSDGGGSCFALWGFTSNGLFTVTIK